MNCTACGAGNDPGARFCSSCGHKIAGRGDERRVVTVLFADVVGFTHLSEGRDPEQVKNVVDRCFERLAQDITACGGRIDKVMGDALLALFGAPVAHEDDAERAVRAALRMQNTLRTYTDEAGAEIQMRIGVNTGEVLVGSLRAGDDYTAMGDVVNTTQRIQTAAEPGTVLVGPATHAATSSAIDYCPAGLLHAKGRDEPVETFTALAPLLPPGGRRRDIATPFTGRQHEAGLLGNAARISFEQGRAALALITGEAGMGKSRLAEEVASSCADELGAVVLEGRCVPYGEANVWWPVAEAMRQALGIGVDDSAELAERTARAHLEQALAGSSSADLDRVQRGLLALIGYATSLRDIDPTNAREETTWSVQAYLDGVSRQHPVLVVVSDLHWAEPVVLDLLAASVERLARSRLALFVTARPELLERWTPPTGRHNAMLLNLEPLDAATAADLLGSLAPELDGEVIEVLVDRSGGNPFFLEELVALVQVGDVSVAASSGRSGMRAAADGGGPAVDALPETLRGLMAARLDALGADARDVVDDAAVWGRAGPVEALQKMAEVHGIDSTDAVLDELGELELIIVDGETWQFRSDLVREVAYLTLTKSDRARRHAGIAWYFDSAQPALEQVGDRMVEVVAHHYGAAAELGLEVGHIEGLPPDLDARAVAWIEEAVNRAKRSQSSSVMARLLDQGLVLLEGLQTEQRCRFLLGSARVHAEFRELDLASERIEAAASLCEQLDEDGLRAQLLLARGELEQKRGEVEASVASLRAAADAFASLDDRSGRAEALRLCGVTLLMASQNDGAEELITEALDVYREIDDRRGEAWALQNLAWIAFVRGAAMDALDRLEVAIETFEDLGDSVGLSWALGLSAYVRYHLGEFDEAELLAEQILVEARQRGDRWGEAMMLLLVAGVRLWSGRAPAAVLAAHDSLEVFESINDVFSAAQAMATVGRAQVLAGEVDTGLMMLTEALDRYPVDHGAGVERRIVAGALAGAAVQIGDVDLASRALADWSFDELSAGDIGDTDLLTARGLFLLQSGELARAHDSLLRAADPGDTKLPSAYARAALSLALAVMGASDDAEREAAAVMADQRATYADKNLVLLGRLIIAARESDGLDVAAEALRTNAAGAEDPVHRAVSVLGIALALRATGDVSSELEHEHARRLLGALGIEAAGWVQLFDEALAAATRPARARK